MGISGPSVYVLHMSAFGFVHVNYVMQSKELGVNRWKNPRTQNLHIQNIGLFLFSVTKFSIFRH